MADKDKNIVSKTYPGIDFLQANQFGEVRTLDHYATRKDGKRYFVKGHVLKQQLNKNGYLYVDVHINGKHIQLQVHRIVATCFLPNPDNLPQVNHKDCNPKNNSVSNLEFCTPQYNTAYREKYGVSAKESTKVLRKSLFAVNLKTLEVLHFESQHEAARQLGVKQGNICNVLKGRQKQTGGYWFCYADSNAVEETRAKFGDEVADKVEKLMNEKM